MATVQNTNDQLETVAGLLDQARDALLKSDDGCAYRRLAQCLLDLGIARLYVAESEAEGTAYTRANQRLESAAIYLQAAQNGLLGESHTTWDGHNSVPEKPDRTWVASQVAACRMGVLEADNILMLNLVSVVPLSTHLRLVEAQTACEDEDTVPHYESGHGE